MSMVMPALRRPYGESEGVVANPGTAAGRHTALVELGRMLRDYGYSFTAVTPATHARVDARAGGAEARNLREVFGWSRPFRESLLSPAMRTLMERAEVLEPFGEGALRSRVRFASVDELLCVHSAWPTLAPDSVFFGPDSYRFVVLIRRALAMRSGSSVETVVDIGCGSGVGGLVAARALRKPPSRLVLADICSKALDYARINAELNGLVAECRESDVLQSVTGEIDLILANPPYLVDPAHRLYRDGGGVHGSEISLRIVREALARLAPGGRLILYTGAAVVEGEDQFRRAVTPLLNAARARYDYREIDPDVFGEELETPAYAGAERIAAVGLVAHMEKRA